MAHSMRRGLGVLLNCGLVVAVLGFGKLHAVAHGYDFTASYRFAWALSYIAILALAAYGLGFPELRGNRRVTYLGAVQVSLAGALGISLVQLFVGDALLPRFVVFGAAAVVVPWTAFCARLAEARANGPNLGDRVVLVAGEEERQHLIDELAREPERRAELVGRLAPEAASTVSGRAPLLDLARSTGASVVVLSRDAQIDESIIAQVSLLHENGVRVRTIPMFFDQWMGKVPVTELERNSLFFDVGEVHNARYGPVKRIFDITLALPGLALLVLVLPGVVLGNLLGGNRGPLFFRQERVGKNGRPFSILKFRSMTTGAGEGEWTAENDARVTPFGGLLRASHLDELPQVVNILRGDLSVVGPRPEQPQYANLLAQKLPFYELRHLVRPGLTGWAQVKYGYASNEGDALEKLQYEFFYLRHQSLRLDARIVGRTVRSVVGRAGR